MIGLSSTTITHHQHTRAVSMDIEVVKGIALGLGIIIGVFVFCEIGLRLGDH
jgi:hypothetical protein